MISLFIAFIIDNIGCYLGIYPMAVVINTFFSKLENKIYYYTILNIMLDIAYFNYHYIFSLINLLLYFISSKFKKKNYYIALLILLIYPFLLWTLTGTDLISLYQCVTIPSIIYLILHINTKNIQMFVKTIDK